MHSAGPLKDFSDSSLSKGLLGYEKLYAKIPVISSEKDYGNYPGTLDFNQLSKSKANVFKIAANAKSKEKKTIIISDWSLAIPGISEPKLMLVESLLKAGFAVRYWNGREAVEIIDPRQLTQLLASVKPATKKEIELNLAQEKDKKKRLGADRIFHLDYFGFRELISEFRSYFSKESTDHIQLNTLDVSDLTLFREGMPKEIEHVLRSKEGPLYIYYNETKNTDCDQLKWLLFHADISGKIEGLRLENITDISLFADIAQLSKLRILDWSEKIEMLPRAKKSPKGNSSENVKWDDFLKNKTLVISLHSLQKLIIQKSSIPGELITEILECSPNLQELTLDYCGNLSNTKINFPLGQLHSLTLLQTVMDPLIFLSGNVPKLESLYLLALNLDHPTPFKERIHDVTLEHLTDVELTGVDNAGELVNYLIENAPLLNKLHLEECKGLKDCSLTKSNRTSLPNLQRIVIHVCDIPPQTLGSLVSRAHQLTKCSLLSSEPSLLPEYISKEVTWSELTKLTMVSAPLATRLKMLSKATRIKQITINENLNDVSLSEIENYSLDHIEKIKFDKCEINGEIVGKILDLARNVKKIRFNECDGVDSIRPEHIPDRVFFVHLKKIVGGRTSSGRIRGDTLAKLISQAPHIQCVRIRSALHLSHLRQYENAGRRLRLSELNQLRLGFGKISLNAYLYILSCKPALETLDLSRVELNDDFNDVEWPSSPLWAVKEILVTNHLNTGKILGNLLAITPHLERIKCLTVEGEQESDRASFQASDLPDELTLPRLTTLSLAYLDISGQAAAKLISSSKNIREIDFSHCSYLDDLAHDLIDEASLQQLDTFSYDFDTFRTNPGPLPFASVIKLATAAKKATLCKGKNQPISRTAIHISSGLGQSMNRFFLPSGIQFPSIETLSFSSVMMDSSERGNEFFMSLINAMPNLKNITFEHSDFLDNSTFPPFVQGQLSLESLKVKGNSLPDKVLQAIISSSSNLKQLKLISFDFSLLSCPTEDSHPALEVISLQSSTLPPGFCENLIKNAATLQKLEIHSCHLSTANNPQREKGVTIEASVFEQLTKIDIFASDFDPELLSHILARAPQLTFLHIALNSYHDQIFNVIEKPLEKLTTLSIENQYLSNKILLRLPFLFPNLKKLIIKKCNAMLSSYRRDDQEVISYHFSQLEELDCSGTVINAACAERLIGLGSQLTSITFTACPELKGLNVIKFKNVSLSSRISKFYILSSKERHFKIKISLPTMTWLLTQNPLLSTLELNNCNIVDTNKTTLPLLTKLFSTNQLKNISFCNSQMDHLLLHFLLSGTNNPHLRTNNIHSLNLNFVQLTNIINLSYFYPAIPHLTLFHFSFAYSNLPLEMVLALHESMQAEAIAFHNYDVEPVEQKKVTHNRIQLPSVSKLTITKSTFDTESLFRVLTAAQNIEILDCRFHCFNDVSSQKTNANNKNPPSFKLEDLEDITLGSFDTSHTDPPIRIPLSVLHTIIVASPHIKCITLLNVIFEGSLPSYSFPDLSQLTYLRLYNTQLPEAYLKQLQSHASQLKIVDSAAKHRQQRIEGNSNTKTKSKEGPYHYKGDEDRGDVTSDKKENGPSSKQAFWKKLLDHAKTNASDHLDLDSYPGVIPISNQPHRVRLLDIRKEDGNTSDSSKTNVRMLFTPPGNPRHYRLRIYDTVNSSKDGTIKLSLQKVDQLYQAEIPALNGNEIVIIPSREQLYAHFKKKRQSKEKDTYALCAHDMVISETWSLLPFSKKAQKILEFYTDYTETRYEIKYLQEYNSYFIRALSNNKKKSPSEDHRQSKVSYILQKKPRIVAKIHLPQEVNSLIDHCSHFKKKPIQFPPDASGEEILQIRYEQSVGSCQERALIFHSKATPLMSDLFCILFGSDSHIWPEVGDGNTLKTIEMGGYKANKIFHPNPDLAQLEEEKEEKKEEEIVSTVSSSAAVVQPERIAPAAKPPRTREEQLNPAFSTWKTEPKNTSPPTVQDLCAELAVPSKNIRLILKNLDHDLFVLATFAAWNKTPFLFIDTADELQWRAAGLKYKSTRLKVKGPFSRLRKFIQDHPQGGVIFINFNRFCAADTVALHSVLKERQLEGDYIPAQFTMVSLHSEDIAGVYQEEDFITRHDKTLHWLPHYHEGIDLFHERRTQQDAPPNEKLCVDLFESHDWESLLFGKVHIHQRQLSLKPSAVLEGVMDKEHPLPSLHLNNPPWHLREFQIFWQQALQQHYFVLYGKTFYLSDDFQLSYSSQLQFPLEVIKEKKGEKEKGKEEQVSTLPNPLNSQTFTEFFDDYCYQDHSMVSYSGLLRQHQDGILSVTVVGALSSNHWSRLLTTAKEMNVILNLYCLPEITFPVEMREVPRETRTMTRTELSSEVKASEFDKLPYAVIVSPGLQESGCSLTTKLLEYDSNALYIRLDASHDFGDLFYQIQAKLTADGIDAQLKESDPWLALKGSKTVIGKTVIIEGRLSETLMQTLTPFLMSGKSEFKINGTWVPFTGKLIIVTDTPIPGARNQFTWEHDSPTLQVKKQPDAQPDKETKYVKDEPTDLSLQACENFMSRLFMGIQRGFEQSSVIALVGSTGIGKTTYMLEEFRAEYSRRTGRKAKLYVGENNLPAFAQHVDKDSDPFYFGDEANLSCMSLSLLRSLNKTNDRPPHLLINGHYDPLSNHKAILAFNPGSDGGARKQDEELSFAEWVMFERPNHAYYYHKTLKPQLSVLASSAADDSFQQEMAKVILAVFDQANILTATASEKFRFTQRHLHLIGILFVHYYQQKEAIKMSDTHLAVAACLSVLGECLSPSKQQKLMRTLRFDTQYEPEQFAAFQSSYIEDTIKRYVHDRPSTFTFTKSRHTILHMLDTLHHVRKQACPHFGLLLEGGSSVGKTSVVKNYLALLGIPFHEITFSKNYQTTREILLRIFNAGEVVLINEFSSGGPLHEKLFNALIMGKDEMGNPPANPGFLAIVTQNGMSLAGRQDLSPAQVARFVFYFPPAYTLEEYETILCNYGLKTEIRKRLMHEFTMAFQYADVRGLSPKPNLRTIMQVAEVVEQPYLPLIEDRDKGKEKEKDNDRRAICYLDRFEEVPDSPDEKEKEDSVPKDKVLPKVDPEIKETEPEKTLTKDGKFSKEKLFLIARIQSQMKSSFFGRLNFFLIDDQYKKDILQELLDDINLSSGKSFLEVLNTWEIKTYNYRHAGSKVGVSHGELIKKHRNFFFSVDRPGVKTATEALIEDLREVYKDLKL